VKGAFIGVDGRTKVGIGCGVVDQDIELAVLALDLLK
jgi:hypothetical protein